MALLCFRLSSRFAIQCLTIQCGRWLGQNRGSMLTAVLPLQNNLYAQGLQLTILKVLSTTESVPKAFTVSCPNGAVEGVCIGSFSTPPHIPCTSPEVAHCNSDSISLPPNTVPTSKQRHISISLETGLMALVLCPLQSLLRGLNALVQGSRGRPCRARPS